MTKEEELQKQIDKYHKTIIKEREIKTKLVKKLEKIKYLVNLPLSRNISIKSGKIDFLAGNNSSQSIIKSNASEILSQIRELL